MKAKVATVFCETHGHNFVEKKTSGGQLSTTTPTIEGRNVMEVYCKQCGEVKVLSPLLPSGTGAVSNSRYISEAEFNLLPAEDKARAIYVDSKHSYRITVPYAFS